jgi:hypothetical protein
MHEGTTTDRVPSVIQITVRWGASILMAKRVSPPKSMPLAGGVGRLELGASGLELVAGGERVKVLRGKRTKLVTDDVEITIDATEDKLALMPLAPPIEGRHAAADVGAFLLHAGALAFCFMWRTPMSHAETSIDELREEIADPMERERIIVVEPDAGEPAADRPAGAAGLGKIPIAARGNLPFQTPVYTAYRGVMESEPTRARELEEASTFGMIGLLANREPSADMSPWSDARFGGDSFGSDPLWGAPTGGSEGAGGLALSGLGQGSGGPGAGIALGAIGTCGGDCKGLIGDITTSKAGHRLRGVRVKMGPTWVCGHKVPEKGSEKGSVALAETPRCSTSVIGRLPPETIQRVVRQNFGRFRVCYTSAYPGEARPETRVSVRFVIGRDGSVSSASAATTGETALASCVTKAFYGLSFPEPEGGSVNVVYPILFTGDG